MTDVKLVACDSRSPLELHNALTRAKTAIYFLPMVTGKLCLKRK